MDSLVDAVKTYSSSGARLGLFGLTVVVATVGAVSMATAEGGNVRYTHAEVTVGGDSEYALVPRAEDQLRGEITERSVEQAFESLRRANQQMYGNSYASASGDTPDQMRVDVHIDSDKEAFAPFIKAEAVYTLTELGIPAVDFPGYTEEGLTRADISTPAYTLTVPVWRVVPPGRVTSAQIRMSDGSLIASDDLERRWSEDREGVVDDIYRFLDSEETVTLREVVAMLPEVGDVRLDEVTPFLEHDERSIREETLAVLSDYDDDRGALEAVSAAVGEESSSELAREMAEFLGGSPDDEFNVEYQFYLIDAGDDDEAVGAAEALAEWDDDDRVVERLSKLLRDERQDLAMAAAGSLEELAIDDERIDGLDDSSISADVRHRLAEDLSAETNSEEVRLAGLTYLAREQTGGHANQALRTMADLELDEARRGVEEFLDDGSRDRRRTAMEALVDRGDVESVAALMETSVDVDAARTAAYDLMVAQSLDVITEQTEADSEAVQEVAYRAIGERAMTDGDSAAAVETIEAGIDHREAAIRGAAATSLGQIGGDDALETLGELTDDPSPSVRRDVAHALGEFSTDEHADTLVDYLDDDDPEVIAAAIDALEQRDDDRAQARIDEMRDHDAPVVRASALRAVTTFLPGRDDDTVTEHIGMLSGAVGDDAVEVQKSALEQLGRFEVEMAVTNIASLVNEDEVGVRTAAVRALANTGHDNARRLIESRLDDDSPEVRRVSIEALTELVGSQARSELEARMEQEDDPEVRELLEQHLQQI